ncbi:protein kinase [Planctomycetota bacterium]|nr:protein kinase [Planctomycetota bacterium]
MEMRKLAPGDRILDYRILDRIGEGGFGQVFRAEHEVLGRIVAIKVPRDEGSLAALRHEGVVQAQLEHPSIVRTLELSISHDPPYVVMEFVNGESLAGMIKREGAIPWRRAARVLLESAQALAFAHSRGVIHGDIKPGNLLVEPGRNGRVLLTDFGLGRVFEGPQGNLQISRSLELATSGAEVQGTIRYLAPEVLRGETADERADLYSFGVLVFETITGRLPEGREIPSELVRNLPPEFDAIFTRTFTRKERRPRSMDSIIEDLERLLDPATKGAVRAIPAEIVPVTQVPPRSGALNQRKQKLAQQKQQKLQKAAGPKLAKSTAGDGTVGKAPKAAPIVAAASDPRFGKWRDHLLGKVKERMAGARGVGVGDGHGFDTCFGVTTEGEPHHRVYALVVPELDANGARATVGAARKIFEREKGIWEKEVTFYVATKSLKDKDQVLWAFKSFSMGWWRRRRVILHDLETDKLYATELGCDPNGNPLKRSFAAAVKGALLDMPAEIAPDATRVSNYRRCGRRATGTAWGAALAVVMAAGLLGTVMAVEFANRHCNRDASQPTIGPAVGEDPAVPVAITPVGSESLSGDAAIGTPHLFDSTSEPTDASVGTVEGTSILGTPQAEESPTAIDAPESVLTEPNAVEPGAMAPATPAELDTVRDPFRPANATPAPVKPRAPEQFVPDEPAPRRYFK